MKKNKSILTLILLFLISNIAVAQNVKIKGNVNEPNALVRLLTYNDMLTYEQTAVYETKSTRSRFTATCAIVTSFISA